MPRASRGKHLFHPSCSVEVLQQLWNQLPVKMEASCWQRCLLSLFGCRKRQFLHSSIANPTGTSGARRLWRCWCSSTLLSCWISCSGPIKQLQTETSTLQQLAGQTHVFQSNHAELSCSADCTWAHLTPRDHLHWSILWRKSSSIKGDTAPLPLRSASCFVLL